MGRFTSVHFYLTTITTITNSHHVIAAGPSIVLKENSGYGKNIIGN